jgi:Uma2 family endonuclease
MATATPAKLLTAEEYLRLPDLGVPTELVRGEIVEMNRPGFRHGVVCGIIAGTVREFAKSRSLGRIATNDSGVVTERGPDTVRGPDVAYYSYQRVPKGQTPKGYPDQRPEITFEVLSPDDRWKDVHAKVAEYLAAGVDVVVVVDPDSETAHVSFPDQPGRILEANDRLEFPGILPGFSVSVAELLSDE